MKILPFVFTAMLPAHSWSQTLAGNDLHSSCNGDNLASQGYCIGYVIGIVEGIRYGFAFPLMASGDESVESINAMSDTLLAYCPPTSTETGQYVDIAMNYLRDHPETRHHPARGLVLNSLQEAFPCE